MEPTYKVGKPPYKVGQVVAVNPYYGGGIMKITEVAGIIDDTKQCFYRGEVYDGVREFEALSHHYEMPKDSVELHAEEDLRGVDVYKTHLEFRRTRDYSISWNK